MYNRLDNMGYSVHVIFLLGICGHAHFYIRMYVVLLMRSLPLCVADGDHIIEPPVPTFAVYHQGTQKWIHVSGFINND